MTNRPTSPSAPPFPDQKEGAIQEAYTDAFSLRLRIGRVFVSEGSGRGDLFPYTMKFPVYGPHRNRGDSASYFDDRPHVRDYAELHADAFQLGPLTGEVQGYGGDHLLGDEVQEMSRAPLELANSEEIRGLIGTALEESGYWPSTEHVVVGPSGYISDLLYDAEEPEETVSRLESDELDWVGVPKLSAEWIYIVPRTEEVAVLRTDPCLGEVRFGEPEAELRRYVIQARACNRLEIRDGQAVRSIPIEDGSSPH